MGALNPKVIAELRALEAGAPNFLAELVDLFLKESGPRIRALQEALRDRDAAALEKISHTLKGSSGNLGAEALSQLCGRMQHSAREPRWPELEALTREIVEEYARAETELNALRRG